MNDFDYLDECVGTWEMTPANKLTRQQQAVLDVSGTITFISGDGLLHVWSQSGDSMDRIIESFRMAGISEIADLLQESSFCKSILERTPPDAEDWQCTKEEEVRLRDIELFVSDKEPDAREGLLQFLPDRKSNDTNRTKRRRN